MQRAILDARNVESVPKCLKIVQQSLFNFIEPTHVGKHCGVLFFEQLPNSLARNSGSMRV